MRIVKQENPNDPYSPYYCEYSEQPHQTGLEGCCSVSEMFRTSVEKYASKPCLGSRPVLRKVLQEVDGKFMIKKDFQNEYKFITYRETSKRMNAVAAGLSSIGLKAKHRLAIMMETRMEFFLTSSAAFKVGATIATVYANLGKNGIIHCLNEMECEIIVTSNELLPLIREVMPQLQYLRKVVAVQDDVGGQRDQLLIETINGLQVYSFDELEVKHRNSPPIDDYSLTRSDIALIMYTSGSTGVPKGVLIPHDSLLSIIHYLVIEHGSFLQSEDNCLYAAYLPMAHIFEFMMVFFNICIGVGVGFSGPLTLTENASPYIHPKDNLPDIILLKPSFMIAVPLTMDKMRAKVKSYSTSLGLISTSDEDPVDPEVKRWFLDNMGGKLKRVLVGGARFSESTHKFASLALELDVRTIYGATETCALGTMNNGNDMKFGFVGIPNGCRIRLIDWPEAGYSPKDKPSPRGEILISGQITSGYFKNDAATEENFLTDDLGRRWWRSGDIARLDSEGYIQIIDRKKDLVKPPRGEYISPAAIEAELKSSPFVGNICVSARSDRNFVVALILPNRQPLTILGQQLGIDQSIPFDQLCEKEKVVEEVRKDLLKVLKDSKLSSIEKPKRIKLCTEDWTPESGLVTAAMKIRRRQINDFYQADLDVMFSESGEASGTDSNFRG